ncbi:MAG: DUF1638 domain-containing protein [Armatimonadetes bacterium]|nr:DUF1638 domain-containing protein [Armatimonadota bacterium]
MPVRIIACGVFERELQALAGQTTVPFDVELLDAGLHDRPDQLHLALQESIDRATGYEAIGLLYGLCGRGAAGLIARDVPLVIPRAHDCVAVFLGSPEAYREQFRATPGTLYLTPGWFEQKVHPDSLRLQSVADGWWPDQHPKFAEWSDSYGADNAKMIVAFLEAWRGNYERIALIDNGLGDPERYQQYARELSAASGWRYERLRGRLDWIHALVDGPHSPAGFLTVPPGHRVVTTHDARIFAAVPTGLTGQQPGSGAEPGRFVFRDEAAPTQRTGYGLGIDAGGTYTDAAVLDFGVEAVVAKAKAPTTHEDLMIGVGEALGALDRDLLGKVSVVSLSTTLATNALVEDRGASVGLLLMPVDAKAAEMIATRPLRIVPGKLSIDGAERQPVDQAAVLAAVDELLAEGVEAIAVSGYGGASNPAHEQLVARLAAERSGLPVVCGHELTGRLNFVRRAHTAVLNARLMPVINRLLDAVASVLAQHGVRAPLYVVRGDGSLLAVSAARQRPIETIATARSICSKAG